jgi:hypothetical protein
MILAEYSSDGNDVAHALLRAAPRLISAPAGGKGRDESRPGRLKPAPQRASLGRSGVYV